LFALTFLLFEVCRYFSIPLQFDVNSAEVAIIISSRNALWIEDLAARSRRYEEGQILQDASEIEERLWLRHEQNGDQIDVIKTL
jgi:hypothetical protein